MEEYESSYRTLKPYTFYLFVLINYLRNKYFRDFKKPNLWLLAEASIWRALLTPVTKEKGKLLEPMNHEETLQAPFLVVTKERGGALTCFSERILLLFNGLTPNANILNDREKEILPDFLYRMVFLKIEFILIPLKI